MPQSLTKNYIHLVFSTKYRLPIIVPNVEDKLHAYLGGTCKALSCPVLAVGGYVDHVHILFILSKNIALKDLVQRLKAHSSKWIKTQDAQFSQFYWQLGYGAFSISQKDVESIRYYIKNQHHHHTKEDFQTEFRSLLAKYEIDFDERYVWD